MITAVRAAILIITTAAIWATVGGASDNFDKQPADAKFRYIAREMYEDLATPSCKQLGVPAGFNRMASLSPERAAVTKFEDDVKGTPAAYQLEVVKNDRMISGEDVGCMADDDIRFAKKHLEWAKEGTKRSLERMLELAPSLPGPPKPDLLPKVSAGFRKKVRYLVWRPECQQTSQGTNETIFAPSQQLIDDFKRSLTGTPFEFHFNAAAADVKLKDDITVAECDEPGSVPVATLQKRYLNADNRLVAELKAIMAQPTGATAAKP